MTTEMTVNEAMETITGFDEIAIETHMGYDIYTDDKSPKHRPILGLRSVVFALELRNGLNHVEAKKAALSLGMKQVNDYFAESTPEVDPDDPEGDEGKDGSTGDSEPGTSPSSV